MQAVILAFLREFYCNFTRKSTVFRPLFLAMTLIITHTHTHAHTLLYVQRKIYSSSLINLFELKAPIIH
jgi:hypothetical protein